VAKPALSFLKPLSSKEKDQMRHSKKLAALAIAAGVAVTGTAAFAFWSASGGGTGTGSVAGSYGGFTAVSIAGTVSDNLYPGGSSVVTFKATNNDEGQALAAGKIHLVSVAPDLGHAACNTSLYDAVTSPTGVFSMADVNASAESIAPKATLDLAASGTLNMRNQIFNQDSCKGATLTLTLSSIAQ
jgi:hypothetical protein